MYHFRDWLGEYASREVVTERKWLEFFQHLSCKNADGTWGLEHCDRIIGVARRFVRFLWEMRLVELPRNLDSSTFAFSTSSKEIQVFSVEELQRFHRMATGQSKLHVLLMLNGGFVGQDSND